MDKYTKELMDDVVNDLNTREDEPQEVNNGLLTHAQYNEILERSGHAVAYLKEISRGGIPRKLQGNQIPLTLGFYSQMLQDIYALSKTLEQLLLEKTREDENNG